MDYDYSICTREVKDDTFTNEPGKVRYLKSPRREGSRPDPSHEVSVGTWLEEVRDRADGMADSRVTEGGDVLVLVHGYNNTLETIARRQRYLSEDLAAEGFSGLVIAFDWPCADATLNYIEDRWDAAQVADQLVTKGIALIARGQAGGCETNIHLIGHSTGAYLITEACAQAQKKGSLFKQDWRIGQVAFIGGDISSGSLAADSGWAASLFEHALRITNYSNPFDHVLAVSNAKRLGTAPRAGRVGAPKDRAHAKVVDVGCGTYFKTLDPKKQRFEGTFAHSWHIGSRVFARDLAMTLTSGIDRHAISTREFKDGSLSLQDAPRPKYCADWTLESGRRSGTSAGSARGRK
jgi:esterase/lipase superfamily enzyme